MKFNCIEEFLNYKTQCPFCKSQLSTQLASHLVNDADNRIANFYIKGEEMHFEYHSSYKIPGMIEAGSFYSFNVTLFTKRASIKYNVIKSIQHRGAVSADQFVKGFNNSKLFIGQYCLNSRCAAKYSFCSLPLFFDVWAQPKAKLREPETYFETFEVNKYSCVNSYTKNQMTVSTKDSVKRCTAPFMDLEHFGNAADLENRVRTLITFS